jgi:hypothetical protein
MKTYSRSACWQVPFGPLGEHLPFPYKPLPRCFSLHLEPGGIDERAHALLEQVQSAVSRLLSLPRPVNTDNSVMCETRFWTSSLLTARIFMNSSPTASLRPSIGILLPPEFIPHLSHPEFPNYHLRPRSYAFLSARPMPALLQIQCQTSRSPHHVFVKFAMS